MNHAVAKRRGADFAPLRFVDIKMMIFAGLILAVAKCVLQIEQSVSQLVLKPCRAFAEAFADGSFPVGVEQIIPGDNSLKRVTLGERHGQ